MKKVLTAMLFAVVSLTAGAQEFDYNFGFNYLFDNTEHKKWSHDYFEPSQTVHLADFHAVAGFTMQSGKVKHSVYGGYDISRVMGDPSAITPVEKEFLAYYRVDTKTTYGKFAAVFGVFPRSFSEGEYNEAAFSKANYLTDRNFEGMFLKYRENALYVELGLDWFGLKSGNSRERFQIMSVVDYSPAKWFHAGWDVVGYHFATSDKNNNVVDNVFLHPYIGFSPQIGFQKFSFSGGWIQKYDRDRATPVKTFNGGVLVNLKLKNWNFGIENDFFFGQDMMPNYIGSNNGVYYMDELYFGNRFYHTQIEGFSFYDRAEIYYEPELSKGVKMRVSGVFHFGNPTSDFGAVRGFQQTMAIIIDLNEIRSNK